MSRVTSQLIVELLDRVTEPARKVGRALNNITGQVGDANGRVASVGERLNSAMASNDRALARARGGLMDAAAGAYILHRALSAPVNAAARFEVAMNKVAALSNASEEQMSAMNAQARELGRTTMFSASEAADAMSFLAMAGFETEQIMASLPGTLELAAAGGVELARAADIASNVLSAYGMEVKEIGRVNDVLAATFTSTNTNLDQLAEAMKYAAPVASAAGVRFEEAAAAIGLMGNAGIQGSMAGTSLRGAIARILNPTREVESAMADMGMSAEDIADALGDFEGASADISGELEAMGVSFTNSEGRLRPLSEILRELGPHADDAGLFMRLFGQRAGPAMAALVGQGADALEELTEQLDNSGGTAARIADRQMEGFEGRMKIFRSVVEGLNIAIGNALLPALSALAETTARLLEPVTRLAEAYPNVTAAVVAAAASVIGFRVAIAGLRYLGLLGKGGVLSLIALGYNTIGRAAIGAKVAATNMIGLQAALAGMAGQPLGTLGRLSAGLRGMVLAIPGVAKAGIALKLLGGVLAKLAWPITAVVAGAMLIRRYWDRLSAVFRGVGAAIKEQLARELEWLAEKVPWVGAAVEKLGDAWEFVKEKMSGFSNWVSSAFSGLFGREILSGDESASIEARAKQMTDNLIQSLIGIPDRLGALYSQMHAAGVELIQSLYQGALERWETFIDWVRRIPQMIRDAIGRIDLRNIISWPERPSWLGGSDGSANPAAGPGGVPARAKGGPITRGGTYLVGEEGPELIHPARNGYVHPAGETADMLGARAGAQPAAGGVTIHDVVNNVNVTVTTPNASPKQIADQVGEELERRMRAALRGVMADTGIRLA